MRQKSTNWRSEASGSLQDFAAQQRKVCEAVFKLSAKKGQRYTAIEQLVVRLDLDHDDTVLLAAECVMAGWARFDLSEAAILRGGIPGFVALLEIGQRAIALPRIEHARNRETNAPKGRRQQR